MLIELYGALRKAGASEKKARAAAQAVAHDLGLEPLEMTETESLILEYLRAIRGDMTREGG